MDIFVHDALEYRAVVFQPEASQRVGERIPRDDREVLIAPHQRTQPGIFELLDAPDLGDDLAVAGKRFLGDRGHRLNVVQRAIGVEHNGLIVTVLLFLFSFTDTDLLQIGRRSTDLRPCRSSLMLIYFGVTPVWDLKQEALQKKQKLADLLNRVRTCGRI